MAFEMITTQDETGVSSRWWHFYWRHVGLWFASNLVFALDLYVVLDFDRPWRGLIRVDQTPLIKLDASFSTSSKL